MPKEESKLEKLKKEFSKIQSKYKLPSFNELNEDFSIEKIEDESDFLVREVRRHIAEKFSNYLRFLEALLNPTGAPMFVFTVVKSLSNDDKKRITEIYKQLVQNEVKLLELDIEFSEKKEVEYIKNTFKMWQEIKKQLLGVVESIKKNWDSKTEGNSKGYFG
ncbi:MAG: hypothetical protein AABY22_27620 [Nanoarchaeota archaeon]